MKEFLLLQYFEAKVEIGFDIFKAVLCEFLKVNLRNDSFEQSRKAFIDKHLSNHLPFKNDELLDNSFEIWIQWDFVLLAIFKRFQHVFSLSTSFQRRASTNNRSNFLSTSRTKSLHEPGWPKANELTHDPIIRSRRPEESYRDLREECLEKARV
ncbi:hypothetical protein M9H77_08038 [Catharanthus roseus]|uniref:Uncharacterized protein n=1 Tax=Catharanthus roseus TaxID=4058 RepID=A0ACC0BWY6_CATRO|nr:hypothetical protein M9H77_08038 [Catharanthus roseus]